jgi:alcohol dehydrogenase (cytochrome c)
MAMTGKPFRRKMALFLCGVMVVQVASAADTPWPSYNGDLSSTRFSPLREITPNNAADLREVCETQLGDEGALQSGPLVVGDTLYVTTIHTVLALDASNCQVRWRSVYVTQDDEPFAANRGVAFMDGRLFRGTSDGWILALDAVSGRELWRVHAARAGLGEFFTGAPVAWDGLVYFGPAGSEWGMRGRIFAVDPATGRTVWQFNVIPSKGEPGYETWERPETTEHGGGGTWSSFTIDPDTSELFAPVGNPAPDFAPSFRPGKNLFTNCVVVLDAKTGELHWYYQLDGNDGFDYDLGATPTIYRDRNGRRRVAFAGKNGYLYIVDRKTHRLTSKTPVTTIKKAASAPTPAGVHVCPGAVGGVEWNGAAFSPPNNALYVGSVDWCFTLMSGPVKYEAPLFFLGTGTTADYRTAREPKTGWVVAADASNGTVRWRYHADSPVLAGVTATAGGVVFSGDSAGNLLIFDSRSGRLLKKENLGGSMGGGIITYQVGDRQFVATTAGNVSRSGLSVGGNEPRLVIFATGLPVSHRAALVDGVPPGEARRPQGTDQGRAVFNTLCAGCHGLRGTGGESGPSLLGVSTRRTFSELVEWIKNPEPPMPKLAPPMSDVEVDIVARYVLGL